MSADSFRLASKAENDIGSNQLGPIQTAGGHPDDRSQPALPTVHRTFANPSPLGLLSFATGKCSPA